MSSYVRPWSSRDGKSAKASSNSSKGLLETQILILAFFAKLLLRLINDSWWLSYSSKPSMHNKISRVSLLCFSKIAKVFCSLDIVQLLSSEAALFDHKGISNVFFHRSGVKSVDKILARSQILIQSSDRRVFII